MTRAANNIKKLETKLGVKRDEIRKLLGDVESIVESFTDAEDSLGSVVRSLRAAREELESATDTMSQYV